MPMLKDRVLDNRTSFCKGGKKEALDSSSIRLETTRSGTESIF